MDSIKDKFFALDTRIKQLEELIGSLERNQDEVHIVSSDKEQGEIPLNEFDTFRFARGEKWPITEYMKLNNSWVHGMKCTSDIYFLINPTVELREQIEVLTGHSVNFSKYVICFKFAGTKHDFESAMYNHDIKDFFLFWYQGGPCYGRMKLSNAMYKELQSKNFEMETMALEAPPSHHIGYDMILKEHMNGMKFSATLTIVFKNKYALVPHISYFISPIHMKSIQIHLKCLTNTHAIFEFKYGKEMIPPLTVLHWMAQGVLVEEKIE